MPAVWVYATARAAGCVDKPVVPIPCRVLTDEPPCGRVHVPGPHVDQASLGIARVPQASYEAAHGTAEIFLAAGDMRRTGMARSNEATALETSGRLDEALQIYRQAADDLEKAGEDQLRASVMQAVAGIQLRKGKIMEALLAMHIGLTGVKQPTLKQKILRSMLKFKAW